MIRAVLAVFALTLVATFASAQQSNDLSEEDAEAAYWAQVSATLEGVEPEHGTIMLTGAPVTLNVPDEFDFYDGKESQTILEDLWGNAPDDTVLGMIFPAGVSPGDETWGAVITYEATGYVSDEDAASQDYDKLLANMQKLARDATPELERQGYPTAELVGWAVEPKYDAESHGVSWAKDLIFSGGNGAHTLNYDMRLLGRRGVLSVNFVAAIDAVQEVQAIAPDVLAIPDFNTGEAYGDYVDGDKTAGYGVAALIAGTTGAVVAKKLGFLGVALLFLKKGWVIILALLGGAGGWFKRAFGGGTKE